MAYNKYLQTIRDQHGATLVAISPMLPDGSQFLASKRDLQFPVVSDCGNRVARDYRITFVVPEFLRPTFEAWGHNIPEENGDDLWELPLAATYIVNQQQEIVWSFIDNDSGCWAEPQDVVTALGQHCSSNDNNNKSQSVLTNTNSKIRGRGSVLAQKPPVSKSLFGPKKIPAGEYVSAYRI